MACLECQMQEKPPHGPTVDAVCPLMARVTTHQHAVVRADQARMVPFVNDCGCEKPYFYFCEVTEFHAPRQNRPPLGRMPDTLRFVGLTFRRRSRGAR